MRVLVTGASGLIGCHAASQLVRGGHSVRAFVRDQAKLGRALEPLGAPRAQIEVAVGEITDPGAVADAMSDCDALLHAAGIFSHRRSDAARLESVNVEGTRVVVDSALAMGLRRIVFVSSMVALFPPHGDRIRADDPVADPKSLYAATKASAERYVRARQAVGAPVTIVYPAACQGPNDPTVSTGPQLVINALRDRTALITEGGLAYSDVRDVAEVLAKLFSIENPPARLMAPSFFLEHAAYHELLSRLSGEELRGRRIPVWLLRLLGRFGDLAQSFGRDMLMTSEAADVLTRSVPIDDAVARNLLAQAPISAEDSFRDLLDWLREARYLGTEGKDDE